MDQGRGWVFSCCLSECLKEEKEEMWRELPEDMKNGIRNLPDKTRSLSISFSTSIYMIYIIIAAVNIIIIVTSGPEVSFHQREELHRREHRAPHQATEENDWDDIRDNDKDIAHRKEWQPTIIIIIKDTMYTWERIYWKPIRRRKLTTTRSFDKIINSQNPNYNLTSSFVLISILEKGKL